MAALTKVETGVFDPRRFKEVLSAEAWAAFSEALDRAEETFKGRTIWNVNSTGKGGGVAEMLYSLLAYAMGAGVDARWRVIEGNPEFFRITKRVHNHLHGSPGDGGRLGPEEHAVYLDALEPNAEALAKLVRPRDIVILHDPQTAGLVAPMKEVADFVVWRCHVGLDVPNDIARNAWDFLDEHVDRADAHVFSRKEFVWLGLAPEKTVIIPPSIDAFSPKNQELERPSVEGILAASGLVEGGDPGLATFVRAGGQPGLVRRPADLVDGGAALAADARIVTQVSRWDRLKDPLGVMLGFADHIAPRTDAHLVLAGPAVEAISDDPEGAEVLEEVRAAHSRMPPDVRARILLAALPMDDSEENAAIVNALQRRSDVVVQKSIAEGFGLTVAEGMWKARPVVASRIGGIQDQIVDGVSGVLVSDPGALAEYGAAVTGLLLDPRRAESMGFEAMNRVRTEFLGPRHLLQYLELLSKLMQKATAS
ncbi:MAG: glycosyltransferase [Actinobacteria bacterium]|nr:glycosyltransferase [Actinomycetota bacterium]